jgi:hypothetical protein
VALGLESSPRASAEKPICDLLAPYKHPSLQTVEFLGVGTDSVVRWWQTFIKISQSRGDADVGVGGDQVGAARPDSIDERLWCCGGEVLFGGKVEAASSSGQEEGHGYLYDVDGRRLGTSAHCSQYDSQLESQHTTSLALKDEQHTRPTSHSDELTIGR